MDILTFLEYYLIVDAILSLIVFGFLCIFRKPLAARIRANLRVFLGIHDSEGGDELEEPEEDYNEYEEEEEEYECPLELCDGSGQRLSNDGVEDLLYVDCECISESTLPKPRMKQAINDVFDLK